MKDRRNDPAEEYVDRMIEFSNAHPTKHYVTAIGPCNPDGYNWELHRDMGQHTCEICLRYFKEHNRQEFVAHWEEIAQARKGKLK